MIENAAANQHILEAAATDSTALMLTWITAVRWRARSDDFAASVDSVATDSTGGRSAVADTERPAIASHAPIGVSVSTWVGTIKKPQYPDERNGQLAGDASDLDHGVWIPNTLGLCDVRPPRATSL